MRLLFLLVMVWLPFSALAHTENFSGEPDEDSWDYESHSVVSGGSYRITITPSDSQSDPDLYIRLNINPTESSYINKSTAGSGNNETINYNASSNGTLRIGVYCYSGHDSGWWDANDCDYTARFEVLSEPSIPSAPSSLSKSNVTNNSARVSWSSVSGATYYIYQYSKDWSFWGSDKTHNGTSLTLTGLSGNTTYDFRVKACNSAGCSGWKTGDNLFTTSSPQPSAPSSLSKSNVTYNSARVSWSSVSGATYYIYQYSKDWSFWGSDKTHNGTSLTLTGLSGNTTYDFRVKACNSAGCSGWKTGDNLFTTSSPQPSAPSSLSKSNVTYNSARVSWSSVSGATYYIYQYSKDWSFWGSDKTHNGTSLTLTGLSGNTTYDFRVKACNSAGCSGWKTGDNLFTTSSPQPSAPSSLSKSNVTYNSARVSWSSVSGATYYIYQYSKDWSFWGSDKTHNGTSLTLTGLSGNTTYDFRVKACNSAGCSGWKTGDNLFTTSSPQPSAPSSLSKSNVTYNSARVSWSSVSGATYYIYQYSKDWSFWGSDKTHNGTSLTLTGLSGNTTYDFRVKACNSAGCSGWKTGDNLFTTSSPQPSAPSSLSKSNVTYNSARVSWSSVSGATYYIYQYSKDWSFWGSDKTHNGTSLTLTGLSGNTTYDFRVKACNSAGCSGWKTGDNLFTTSSPQPSAPSSLSKSNVTYNSARVSWSSVSGATYYIYQYSKDWSFWGSDKTHNGTSLTLTGLSGNTTYDFRVKACNSAGCSGWKTGDNLFTTSSPQPDLIISSLQISNDQIVGETVSFTASVKNIGNAIWDQQTFVANDDFKIDFLLGSTLICSTSYNTGDIAINGTKNFSCDGIINQSGTQSIKARIVKNTNAPNEISTSNNKLSQSFTWKTTIVPNRPNQPIANNITVNSARVSWSPVSNASYYIYQFDKNEIEFDLDLGLGWGNEYRTEDTVVVLTNLDSNTFYDFRVRACNSGDQCSDWQEINNGLFSTLDDEGKPNLRISGIELSSAVIDEPTYMTLSITNDGESATEGAFEIQIKANNKIIRSITFDSIINENRTWSVSNIAISFDQVGQNEITVLLDSGDAIDEADENDNHATKTIVVREQTTADSVGTTIITHGFSPNGSIDSDSWQTKMAEAIADRAGGAVIRIYNKATGLFTTHSQSCTWDNELCEQILIFDWLDDSNEQGGGFSEAAAEALFSSLLEGERLGHFNLNNLHFIGHSRGTVVNSEAVERLLILGKSVSHVTMLDPHDWGLGVIAEDFDVNPTIDTINIRNEFVRPGVVVWEGVTWSDNYYQDTNNLLSNVGGRSVLGTNHEVYLPQIGHSKVHSWYHGTIDIFIDQEDLPEGDVNLFAGTGSNRETDGFNQGRIARGSVPQEARSIGQTNPQFSFTRTGHGVVNGDFSREGGLLEVKVNRAAGWNHHGGGTDESDSGNIKNKVLELDWRSHIALHNRIYLSDNINSMSFDIDITDTSDDDKLVVSFCKVYGQGGKKVYQLDLNNMLTTKQVSFPIPDEFKGRSCSIEFKIVAPEVFGADVDSEVRIDNIVFGLPQPKGRIRLDSLAMSDLESSHQTVKLVREGGSAGSLTMEYKTVEGSAQNGQDFVSTSGKVFFADGVTSQTIVIQIIDDSIQENMELFYFVLTDGTTDLTATVSIVDDDAPSEQVQSVFFWYENNGSNTQVEFKSNTEGASIYYTLDGSNPTLNSQSISNGSKVTFTADAVIKAMAVKKGLFDSQLSIFNVILNRYRLNVSNSSNCAINIQPNTGIYKHGSTVSLQTENCDGYQFRNWSGDISSSEVTAEVLMDGNKNIQANFDVHAILANQPQSSLNPARSSDSVTFSVEATSTLGFALSYQWSAQCSDGNNGTFSAHNASQTNWTAPTLVAGSNDVICSIQVKIGDTESLSELVEIEQVISGDAIDDTPDDWVVQNQQARSGNDVLSNIIQITGINVPVTASVSANSQISINYSRFTSGSVTVQNNDFVQVKTFVDNRSTENIAVTLNVGNTSASYIISVLGEDSQVKATINSAVADSRYENELIGTIVHQSEQVISYFESSFTDTLTYAIVSTNTGLFSINSVTGEVTLSSMPDDVHVGTQTVLIQAIDAYNSSATVMLYVPIINVNDVPQVTTDSITTKFFWINDVSSGTIIVNSTEMNNYFRDEDGDDLTYAILDSKASTNIFSVNSTNGELMFSRALNSADLTDQKITVAATDMHQTTAQLIVTIPIITSQSYRLATFDSVVDAQRNAVQQSEIITLEGFMGTTMSLSVTGGEYRVRSDDKDWNSWSSQLGEIEDGHQLQVRHISASEFNTTQVTTIKLGDDSVNFVSVTKDQGTTPLPFNFSEVKAVQPNQIVESESVVIKGLDGETTIKVSGGQYQLDNGSWQSKIGSVRTGQILKVRMIASSEYSTSKTMKVIIGSSQVSFVTHTLVRDTVINAIKFNTITNVPTSTLFVSNLVYITGINAPVSISLSGSNGEYSTNGGVFTDRSGQLNNGDSLRLRLRSATTPLTTATIHVNLGGSIASFSVLTKEQQTTIEPDTRSPALQIPSQLAIEVSEGSTGVSNTDSRITSFLTSAYSVDDRDGVVSVSNNAPQWFSIGQTLVTFTAIDSAGNQASLSGTVNIQLPPDTIPPVFSKNSLPELNISATGFYTPISKLNTTTVTATDNRDGAIVATHNLYYPLISGHHNIIWTATDKAGNKSVITQSVKIYPKVNLSNDQYVAQGGFARITAILQGPAPDYPVVVPINLKEHPSLFDLNLVIGANKVGNRQKGLSGQRTFSMMQPNNSSYIEASLADNISNAIKGNNTHMKIYYVETQVAPISRILVNQSGINTAIIDRSSSFTLTAQVIDPNISNTHTYEWEFQEVGQSIQTANTTSIVVDASQRSGNSPFRVKLKITDSDGLFTVNEEMLRLIDLRQMEDLRDDKDSDNDGISDKQEGYIDSDDDGILDYLDDNDVANVIPTSKTLLITLADGTTQTRMASMNTRSGLKLKLGKTAISAGRTNVNIQLDELAQFGNRGGQANNTSDTGNFNFHGNALDFEVSGLSQAGDSIAVVVPLESILPSNAHYRKFQADTGWQEFKVNANNKIESAMSEQGICPEVDATNTWSTGLTQGYDCLRLTIEDGGANDSDGIKNAKVADPGAIFTLEEIQVNVANTNASHTNLIKAIRISANQDNLIMSTLSLSFSFDVATTNIPDVMKSITVYKDNGDGLLDSNKDSKIIDGHQLTNQSSQSFAFSTPQAITRNGVTYYLVYNP